MSWPLVKLGDCCTVVGGATPKREKSEYWDSPDIPWVTPKDVSNLSHPVLDDAPEYISELGYKSCSAQMLPEGAILLTSRAPIGNVAIAGRAMCTNQGFKSLVPGEQVFGPFLYHCVKHYSAKLESLGNGATFKEVSKKIVEDFEIPLPPLEEQKRIAAILDKADAIRRKRQQAIKLADDFLRSVFLEMFGDPVTNPKGWEVKSLKDLASKIGSGSTPRGGKEAYVQEGISLVRSLNIHDDEFLHKNLAFITDKQAKELSNVSLEKNDVLLNITGASVCRCALVDNSVLPARVNQHVCIIRPKELEPEFLLHTLISTSFKQQLLKIAQSAGATREALTKDQVENLKIPVPPKNLQEKFASIKNRVRSLLAKTGQSNEMPLFESLSQKAFSGEL